MTTPTNMDGMLGVAFLGNTVAAVLYGIICLQTFLFLRSGRGHEKDAPVCWRIISVLWTMDTVTLAFTTHAAYYYMISSYGNTDALASPTWSVLAMVYISCVSNTFVRIVFGRRAWFMTGQRVPLAICILVPSLGAFAGGITISSLEWSTRTFENFSKISYLLYLAFGSGFVADGVIAVSLSTALWRSRTGFPKTDSVLKTLMFYTINTGLLTSLCNLACFVAYAVRPHEFIFLAFYFILSKLYLNSLLAVLNGQEILQAQAAASALPCGLANIPAKEPPCLIPDSYLPRWCPTNDSPIVVDISQDVVSDLESHSQASFTSDASSIKERHVGGQDETLSKL